MSRTIERILQEARALSAEERDILCETLKVQRPAIGPDREIAAKKLFGEYTLAPTSSAEFSARKAADLTLEKHRQQ